MVRREVVFYFLVGLGGALGGTLRFLISDLMLSGAALPWGTLVVNTVGSLLIGLYASLPTHYAWTRGNAHVFMTAGFFGGLTTFSIFSLEVVKMLEGGAVVLATGWLVLSVVLWLTGVATGYTGGSRAFARDRD